MLMARGVAEIVDLRHHPFGNSYFPTAKCGGAPYDPDTRHCWAKECTSTDVSPPSDCFTGTPVAQHGETEYDVDRVQACAQSLTTGDPSVTNRYWPFVVCTEKHYERKGEAAAHSCAKETGVDYARLNACYTGDAGDAAVAAQAKATIDHPGTPYIAVNGEAVQGDDVLSAVCAAYKVLNVKGATPAGCSVA